jgi:ATP-dependent Lon protease
MATSPSTPSADPSAVSSTSDAPRPLAILPLRSGVLLPDGSLALTVGRARSIALVDALAPGDVLGLVAQIDSKTDEPRLDELHSTGTVGRLVQVHRGRAGEALRITVQGLGRVTLESVVSSEPYLVVNTRPVADRDGSTPEARALAVELSELLSEIPGKPAAFEDVGQLATEPSAFCDRVATLLGLDASVAQRVLAEPHVPSRLRVVVEAVSAMRELASLRKKIGEDVRKELGKNQREHLLREQLRAIRRELGDDGDDAVERLRARLDEAGLSDEARRVADRELDRFEQTGGQGAEANVIRTYLEWLASLPWSARASLSEELEPIAQRLDADHTGLSDVKKRVLEHMAVRKLTKSERGSILCLVGPPGVGKTSLGQSIADATGRPFVRVSLGGVRDEAEIRGHRRTYVGALPGRILHALKKAKVKNPVVLLDEIDKLSQHWGGAAESALLEVLDPEQNRTFVDHYLELPFDLSEVLFLCTANTLDTLSAPLRDRLEIVEVRGYTSHEKRDIARRHLVPKRLRESGLTVSSVTLTDDALSTLITKYTREAGVRQLDRELGRIARSLALDVARGGTSPSESIDPSPSLPPPGDDSIVAVTVGETEVARILGKPKYRSDVAERTSVPGVATGLAWTPVGGDILFIESTRMRGKGRLEITGQLGDVMKESARAALSYLMSRADELGIDSSLLESSDLHLHVPAGAVPKDGPSAGVTMFTALASLLTGRRVRPDTAMTGECTLRGRVLPVGGIASKLLAAHRAGIRRIVLPFDNERDLDELPDDVRAELTVHLVRDMSEVLEIALEPLADLVERSTGRGGPEVALTG